MHADLLIKPLISFLNTKIMPQPYIVSLYTSAFYEKIVVERMMWCSFAIITSTLCSYLVTLPPSDPDFDNILKTLVFFWVRIAKTLFKIYNIFNNNIYLVKQDSANDKKIENLNDSNKNISASWYLMALSYTSIGMFLALNPEDLSDFILKPENYHYFLKKSVPINFEMPEIVIKGIWDLLNEEFIQNFSKKSFNIRQNPFSQPKKTSLMVTFISGISFLINRIGISNQQKVTLFNQSKISNSKKMIEILEEKIKNRETSTLNSKLNYLTDIIKYDELHLDVETREYSKCLVDNITQLVLLTEITNIPVIEELCDYFFKMFNNQLNPKWPLPRIEIYSRFSYLCGIKSIIETYPSHINKLRILQNLMELLEHHSDFLLIIGMNTYSFIFQHVYNCLAAFTFEFCYEEALLSPISSSIVFYFYYNQRILTIIFECLAILKL
ncbi:hypothetical protein HZS_3827 [Henneguya salminicola]|nr:hypothetical protein HZS_3827 [Henneguya salminicola]